MNDDIIIKKLKDFLGYDGISFFEMCLEEYDNVCPVWIDCGIPHPVHFREGMIVRNFLRSLKETENWDSDDFDSKYKSYIISSIKLCYS